MERKSIFNKQKEKSIQNNYPLKQKNSGDSLNLHAAESTSSFQISNILSKYPNLLDPLNELNEEQEKADNRNKFYESAGRSCFIKKFNKYIEEKKQQSEVNESVSKIGMFKRNLKFLMSKKRFIKSNYNNKYEKLVNNNINDKNLKESNNKLSKKLSSNAVKSYKKSNFNALNNLHLKFLEQNRELVNQLLLEENNSKDMSNNNLKQKNGKNRVRISLVPPLKNNDINNNFLEKTLENNNKKFSQHNKTAEAYLIGNNEKFNDLEDYKNKNKNANKFESINEKLISTEENKDSTKRSNNNKYATVKSILKRRSILGNNINIENKNGDLLVTESSARDNEVLDSSKSKKSVFKTTLGFNLKNNDKIPIAKLNKFNITKENKYKFVNNGEYFSKADLNKLSSIKKKLIKLKTNKKELGNNDINDRRKRSKSSKNDLKSKASKDSSNSKKKIKNKTKKIENIFNQKQQSEIIKGQFERMRRKLSNFIIYSNNLNNENSHNYDLASKLYSFINGYNHEFYKSDPKIVKLKNFLETVSAPGEYKPTVYYVVGSQYDAQKQKTGKVITNDKTNIFYKSHFIGKLSSDIAFKYRDMIADDCQDNSLKHFINAYYADSFKSRRLINNLNEFIDDL